jgi:hypothetical protein
VTRREIECRSISKDKAALVAGLEVNAETIEDIRRGTVGYSGRRSLP